MLADNILSLFGGPPAKSQVPSVHAHMLDNPNARIDSWEDLFSFTSGGETASGMKLTEQDLLTFTPVMRALRILGGDTACSPLRVCFDAENVKPGDWIVDENHPADFLCHDTWNSDTSAFVGWERLVQHGNLYGSGFAWIERDMSNYRDPSQLNWGDPIGLYSLNPITTVRCTANETGWLGEQSGNRIYVRTGDVYYQTGLSDGTQVLMYSNEVFEYCSFSGVPQLKVLTVIRDVVGNALAAQGFLSKFFRRGGQAGGFVSVPPGMSPKSAVNLQKELEKRQDQQTWFKVRVLFDGAKFHQTTVDPKSMEMNSMNDHAAKRVADFYNLMDWIMGIGGSGPYGAPEAARMQHVTGTMNHIWGKLQGECRLKLLRPPRRRQKRDRMFRHFYEGLVEPDFGNKVKALLDLRSSCVINANDVLKRIGWRTRSDSDASLYFNPTTSSKDLDADSTSPAEPPTDDETQPADTENHWRLRSAAVQPVLTSVMQKIQAGLRNRAKKPQAFMELVTAGFEGYRAGLADELNDIVSLWAENHADRVVEATDQFLVGFAGLITDQLADPSRVNAADAVQARKEAVSAAGELCVAEFLPEVAGMIARIEELELCDA